MGGWSAADFSTLVTVLAALVVAGVFAHDPDGRSGPQLGVVRRATRAAGVVGGMFTVFVALEAIVAGQASVVEKLNMVGVAAVTTVAVALIDVFNDELASSQNRASADESTRLEAALENARSSASKHRAHTVEGAAVAFSRLTPLSLTFAGIGIAIALAMTVRTDRSYGGSYWSGLGLVATLYAAASLVALVVLVSLRVKYDLRARWRTGLAAISAIISWLILVGVIGAASIQAAILVAPAFLLPWFFFGVSRVRSGAPRASFYWLSGRWVVRAVDDAAIARLERYAARARERFERTAVVVANSAEEPPSAPRS